MCDYHGVGVQLYYSRINKGWTVEKALGGKQKETKIELTREINNINAVARAFGSTFDAVKKTQRKTRSINTAIFHALEQSESCTDRKGKVFKNKADMCSDYKIPIEVFERRLDEGWGLEKALETPYLYNKIFRVADFKGNVYKSVARMCSAYNLDKREFEARINDKWSLAEALSGVRPSNTEEFRTKIETAYNEQLGCYEDHIGCRYKTLAKLAMTYGLYEMQFRILASTGVSLVNILVHHSGNILNLPRKGVAFYWNGRWYKDRQFCRNMDTTASFWYKLSVGYTLEEIVRGRPENRVGIVDHNGKEFKSKIAMCQYHRVPVKIFDNRIIIGLSMEDALCRDLKRLGELKEQCKKILKSCEVQPEWHSVGA